jgi:hypothetical protein
MIETDETLSLGRLTELQAMLSKAIANGDDATEVELEAAITHQEQAEASLW